MLKEKTAMSEDSKESIIKIAVPSKGRGTLEDIISLHFGKSDYFIVASVKNGVIDKFEVLEKPRRDNCFSRIDLLARKFVNVLLVSNIGARPYLAAQSRNIEVRKVPLIVDVKDAINSYVEGETSPIKESDICPERDHRT